MDAQCSYDCASVSVIARILRWMRSAVHWRELVFFLRADCLSSVMASDLHDFSNTRPTVAVVTSPPYQVGQERTRTRGFIIAWGFALVFYFLEYAVRSSPSVMISGLATAFGTTALGVSSILG